MQLSLYFSFKQLLTLNRSNSIQNVVVDLVTERLLAMKFVNLPVRSGWNMSTTYGIPIKGFFNRIDVSLD
jgi:hypothetical protein